MQPPAPLQARRTRHDTPPSPHLSPEIRWLVRESVAILGEVIRQELGARAFDRIEIVRARMVGTRGGTRDRVIAELRALLSEMEALTPKERRDFALSYTLMLELMNTCENAYRSHRIRATPPKRSPPDRPDLIIYVLTAHPTEARSPENILAFHRIQGVLIRVLEQRRSEEQSVPPALRAELSHWLKVAWRAPPIRRKKPSVRDEAEHVYSTLLNDDALHAFLRAGLELTPVYARSWVGGDKDGHPGVDEKVFRQSLQLSRRRITDWIDRRIGEVESTAKALRSSRITRLCKQCRLSIRPLRRLKNGDSARVVRARKSLHRLIRGYESEIKALHPALIDLRQLLRVFPAFVVPLELREASDVLLSSPSGKGLAIFRMLRSLHSLSKHSDPRWYVRGMIISMASSIEHIRIASKLVSSALGAIRIPVIPLFEQRVALEQSPKIVSAMLRDRPLRNALSRYWGGNLEVMLGYSDSAKEVGVLPSRLEIADAMHSLDRLCRTQHVTPIFFQGSGGSVDRGGGTIAEQTSGWSSGALRNYKVTLQGEVVERSLATPEITRRQLERIIESAGSWRAAEKRTRRTIPAISAFANRIANHYRSKIESPGFLRLIERATPYRALDALKIGSRPTRRVATLSVSGLRAIPWVLCWTQARVLFPTWWGVGSAWRESSPFEKAALRAAFRSKNSDPVFATFVRALGFTLAKVELPVWRIYLERSGLSEAEIQRTWAEFEKELDDTFAFAHAMLGPRLMEWRPWLEESIWLRSPMIHPLNMLQLVALREQDSELLRITMLGTASGMMNTG